MECEAAAIYNVGFKNSTLRVLLFLSYFNTNGKGRNTIIDTSSVITNLLPVYALDNSTIDANAQSACIHHNMIAQWEKDGKAETARFS